MEEKYKLGTIDIGGKIEVESIKINMFELLRDNIPQT
jgi:hypothetical protein